MAYLSNLVTQPKAWLLLAISALSFELVALFFQYFMGLEPCIMCVYQRLAMFSIFLAGIIGYLLTQNIYARLIAFSLWGVGAIWGLLIAQEHVEMQNATFSLFFNCEIIPNFPSWAPLHEWLPFLFEATGDCGDIKWQFLNYSMPQWMIFIYAIYSVLFTLCLSSRIIKLKYI